MTINIKSSLIRLQPLGHIIYLVVWLLSGGYFFWHFRFGFGLIPVAALIPIWLILGFIWIGFRIWKVWAILIVPTLAIAACFPLTMLQSVYTEWELKHTLNNFILSAHKGIIPAKIEYHGEEMSSLAGKFSQDYTVIATDYLLGGYDYWIQFSTGAKYHITVYYDGENPWSIIAFSYVGEP